MSDPDTITQSWWSSSIVTDAASAIISDHLCPIPTDLIEKKDASVSGRFDRKTGFCLIFLDRTAISRSKFTITGTGTLLPYFDAVKVHTNAVDKINTMPNSGDNIRFNLPSTKTLRTIMAETTSALKDGINFCNEKLAEASPWANEDRIGWLKKKKFLEAVLLHGEVCTIWRNEGKSISGRLSFGGFDNIIIENKGERRLILCDVYDILSGDDGIKRADSRTEEDIDGVVVRKDEE